MIHRLRAVPEQSETHGVLVFQVVLHNPRGWNKAETADRYQGGGQEHPKTPDTAEHPHGVGQWDRRQIDSQPFPIAIKQCMHLECARSLWKWTRAFANGTMMSKNQTWVTDPFRGDLHQSTSAQKSWTYANFLDKCNSRQIQVHTEHIPVRLNGREKAGGGQKTSVTPKSTGTQGKLGCHKQVLFR